VLSGLVTPGEARASDDEAIIIGITAATFGIADLGFFAYDLAMVSGDDIPSEGAAITQVVLGMPQVIGFNMGLGVLTLEEKKKHGGGMALALVAPTTIASGLATHGIWSLADREADPEGLFFLSPLIGSNVALTTVMMTNTIAGRPSGPVLAVGQMLLTAPNVAVGGYFLSQGSQLATWIGFTTWSGALFTHGLISLIWGAADDDSDSRYSSSPPLFFTPTTFAGEQGPLPGAVMGGWF